MGGVFGSGQHQRLYPVGRRLKGLNSKNPVIATRPAVRYDPQDDVPDRDPAARTPLLSDTAQLFDEWRLDARSNFRANHAVGARPQQELDDA